jgi:hypothetical protein
VLSYRLPRLRFSRGSLTLAPPFFRVTVYIPRMMRYGGSTTRGTEMAKWRQGSDGKWVKEKREKKPKPAKGRQAGSVSGILGKGKK